MRAAVDAVLVLFATLLPLLFATLLFAARRLSVLVFLWRRGRGLKNDKEEAKDEEVKNDEGEGEDGASERRAHSRVTSTKWKERPEDAPAGTLHGVVGLLRTAF